MSHITDYLTLMRKLMQEYPQEDFHYANMYDLLLREGHMFEMKPKPDHIEWGVVKECFGNAYKVVAEDAWMGGEQYVYCEGIGDTWIPCEHAWVLDTFDDRAFDVTWKPELLDGDPRPRGEYFGIALPFCTVDEITTTKGTYGVLSWTDLYRRPLVLA